MKLFGWNSDVSSVHNFERKGKNVDNIFWSLPSFFLGSLFSLPMSTSDTQCTRNYGTTLNVTDRQSRTFSLLPLTSLFSLSLSLTQPHSHSNLSLTTLQCAHSNTIFNLHTLSVCFHTHSLSHPLSFSPTPTPTATRLKLDTGSLVGKYTRKKSNVFQWNSILLQQIFFITQREKSTLSLFCSAFISSFQ